jgi:transcriptional regulator with XRE-family HTH domain
MPIETDAARSTEIARKNIRMATAMRETNFSEVARAAGLSRNAVSQFVTRRTTLSYENILKVCAVLDIPIGLLHIEDGVTEGRLRLNRALEALSSDQLREAARLAGTARDKD